MFNSEKKAPQAKFFQIFGKKQNSIKKNVSKARKFEDVFQL
jgi:hypothetical protein